MFGLRNELSSVSQLVNVDVQIGRMHNTVLILHSKIKSVDYLNVASENDIFNEYKKKHVSIAYMLLQQ